MDSAREAIQAIDNALLTLQALGYGPGGDVYDDTVRAREFFAKTWPSAAASLD